MMKSATMTVAVMMLEDRACDIVNNPDTADSWEAVILDLWTLNCPKPIKTEEDYNKALNEIEQYFENEPKPDTPEGDYFEILSVFITAYENDYYPMTP